MMPVEIEHTLYMGLNLRIKLVLGLGYIHGLKVYCFAHDESKTNRVGVLARAERQYCGRFGGGLAGRAIGILPRPGSQAVVPVIVVAHTVAMEQTMAGANKIWLGGIQVSKLPIGRQCFQNWPLADDPKDCLARDNWVRSFHGGRRMDRHGW